MKKVLLSTNSEDSTSTTMVLLLWDIIIKQLASPTEVFSHTNTTIYANLLHLLLSATQRTYDLLNFLTWKFMSMPPFDIYWVHGLIVAMPTIKNLATAWRPNVTPSSIMWASILKKPFGQSFISKKVWSVCQILWLTTVSIRRFSAIDRILCSIILADFWLQDGRFTMISQTLHLIMLISRCQSIMASQLQELMHLQSQWRLAMLFLPITSSWQPIKPGKACKTVGFFNKAVDQFMLWTIESKYMLNSFYQHHFKSWNSQNKQDLKLHKDIAMLQWSSLVSPALKSDP